MNEGTRYVYLIGDGIGWPQSIHDSLKGAKAYALANVPELQWEDFDTSFQFWRANFSAWSIWMRPVRVQEIEAIGGRP